MSSAPFRPEKHPDRSRPQQDPAEHSHLSRHRLSRVNEKPLLVVHRGSGASFEVLLNVQVKNLQCKKWEKNLQM